ncbi:thyroid transcription factor 1-associated protein 26 isoform X2 [Globicephala melas]|uniref:thyroid transcription factor 1-associated protein 26 isoform X2 n=1 Tax=Globicephala melas TaxID=9731 RepID=UPI00293DA17D|nr:thyroid transcription factor 1-associated protein 26 isoform X2 [Globicephala melas]
MAPVRHAARGQTGRFGSRGEGVSLVGFRNKNMKRRTWRPNYPQAFAGSVREGQGFAFRRKLKIQQNYKKLIWKEKKAKTSRESQFTDRYPDHLKHLYLAEEERLRKQLRKSDQSLLEQVDQPLSEEQVDQPLPEEQCSTDQALSEEHCSIEQPHPEEQCSIRIKNLRGENKREKKLKGSTKRRKWKCSKY